SEAALLAGLPKGPVAFSPVINPDRALHRRNLVIGEMESDGAITHAQAEEARQELEKHFGTEEVHGDGLRVDTTLDLDLQQTANRAVAEGVAAYERRHGWKGKLENVLAEGVTLVTYRH